MAQAVYRGVKYNTVEHQERFLKWWNAIHCDATRWMTYRGKKYRAYSSCQSKIV
jgi:hypothetical protein